MMGIYIDDEEARQLESSFKIHLPTSSMIPVQTVMRELRVRFHSDTDVQLLQRFAAALRHLGKRKRPKQMENLVQVKYHGLILQACGTELSNFFAASAHDGG